MGSHSRTLRSNRSSVVGRAATAAILWLGLTTDIHALVYTIENTTPPGTSITFSAAAANASGCATPRAISFSVSGLTTVTNVALGVNISHANRGDLRLTLVAPNGTFLQAVPGGAADTSDNYDMMLSSNTETLLNDGDIDPTGGPFYNRTVPLATLATAFDAIPTGAGTWTLNICDINNTNATVGTFNRARLVLVTTETVAAECTGTTLFNWSIGTPGGAVPGPNPAGLSVAGVRISQASTTDYLAAASVNTRSWLISNPATWAANEVPQGADSSFYSMAMDAVAGNDNEAMGENATFTLTPPVKNFQFSLLDVDATAGSWEDLMLVRGFDSGGNVLPFTMTNSIRNQAAGNLAEGDTPSAAGNTTDGNVAYSFRGDLASVLIEYQQADDPTANGNFQIIGIGDFTFCALDYGDAPATYNGAGGADPARHAMGTARQLYLGSIPPDVETAAQVSANALLDDTSVVETSDDEDGVATFGACPGTGQYTVTVSASDIRGAGDNGTLVGFIDWNRDGDFDNNSNEESAPLAVTRTNADPANYVLTWGTTFGVVPANCASIAANGTSQAYARFRFALTAAEAALPTGIAQSGEVEDYRIAANTLPVTVARVESTLGAELSVRWTTATETANAGFRVLGVYPDGKRRLLATVKSIGADSFVPQDYETTVAADAKISAIEIEDLSLFGERRRHGPFAVGKTFGERPEGAAIDWKAIKQEAGIASSSELMVAAESGHPLQADGGKRSLSAGAGRSTSGALLLVRKEGIHRVTHEQLLAAGVDFSGAQAAAMAVLDNGAGVPRFVSAPSGVFGPGSFVEFVARPRLTLASPVDVLVLTASAGAKAPFPAGTLASGGGTIGVVKAGDVHAADAIYSFASPNGDPWYEQALLAWGAPASLTRTFDLPNLAAGLVYLDLKAWGYGDLPGTAPDHHIVVKVNGVEVANGIFDGVKAWRRMVAVSGLVTASGNILEVVVPGDTGYEYDYVAFEGFAASYSREAAAVDQRFQGVAVSPSGLAVGGFASGEAITIWKTGSSGRGAQRGEQVPVDGLVSVLGAGTVYAAAPAAIFTPAIVPGVPEPLKRADTQYLIVAHPVFATSLDGLVALEESRGFRTEVVTTDRIFAAYSDHASSADALKKFLSASLTNNETLRYVLLVGADTTDPYDHLGLGSISYVPTQYLPFAEYISFSPTDELLVDSNDDGLGDVPIGRLPARTPAELEAMVAKLQNWELNLASAGRGALLVAGASDADGRIALTNLGYQSSLPFWSTAAAQVDSQGVEATRAAVLEALNAGIPLVSFVGHTAPGQWDFTPVLSWQDVANLTASGRTSLITQWGCWNSYYVQPTWESLSARLLRTPGVGAASTIGATTLTTQASHELLGSLFFARVNAGATTLGEAFRGAKVDLLQLRGANDAVLGMTLLGDPAMSLPR